MNTSTTLKKAYIGNLLTAAFIFFAASWMYFGIQEGPEGSPLSASRWYMFKFYTVDSNLLMGIMALIAARRQRMVLSGRADAVPAWVYVLKLVGLIGVTLTMLVTTCYLAPLFPNGWISCFSKSNFFLHLFNPILSLITFLAFERTRLIKWRHTPFGVIPTFLYAIVYASVCLSHVTNGTVPFEYDWYCLYVLGNKSVFIMFPLILLVAYGIGLILWRLNRRRA